MIAGRLGSKQRRTHPFKLTISSILLTKATAWQIRADNLCLNFNKDVQTKCLADVPGYLEMTQGNWNSSKRLTKAKVNEKQQFSSNTYKQ